MMVLDQQHVNWFWVVVIFVASSVVVYRGIQLAKAVRDRLISKEEEK